MDSAGPTGPEQVNVLVESTGPTGPEQVNVLVESTGPTGPDLSMFPSAEVGTTSTPMVIDIAELLASHGAVKNQEAKDLATLSVLLNATRDTLRSSLFVWASNGFPCGFIVQQLELSPPNICSDGVIRSVYDYITYLMKQDMGVTNAAVQALCVGVQTSYSILGSTLRIHVSKC